MVGGYSSRQSRAGALRRQAVTALALLAVAGLAVVLVTVGSSVPAAPVRLTASPKRSGEATVTAQGASVAPAAPREGEPRTAASGLRRTGVKTPTLDSRTEATVPLPTRKPLGSTASQPAVVSPGECAAAYGQYEHPSFTDRDAMIAALPEFLELYDKRVANRVGRGAGGMRLEHSFAVWYTTKKLQPSAIIESGVFKGHSTWLFRHAAPKARIYSIDPGKFGNKHGNAPYFRDTSPLTRYVAEAACLTHPCCGARSAGDA